MEKEGGDTMKRTFLDVVVGVLLVGTSAYAQMGTRGSSVGGTRESSGNGGSIERAPAPSFHGAPGPRVNAPMPSHMSDPRGFGHPGIVGDRGRGDRRDFGQRSDFGDRRVFRGGLFEHGFGRGRGVVVFVYGVPYCYYPDYGYDDSAPYYAPASSYVPDSSTEYAPDPDTQTEQYTNQDADSYYQPGYQWGGEMKLYHVTLDQFVTYLKSYILNSSPVQQAAFRSGFVAHFGTSGQTIYDQAVQQALQPS
jgi:hypothetical protein